MIEGIATRGQLEQFVRSVLGRDPKLREVLGRVRWGTGDPEGVVVAPVSTVFLREDGGAATTFYVKESGTGATGWVGK